MFKADDDDDDNDDDGGNDDDDVVQCGPRKSIGKVERREPSNILWRMPHRHHCQHHHHHPHHHQHCL